MSLPELERMLSAMLPCAGATAVTLTQLPERREALAGILDKAIGCAQNRRARLARIDLPRSEYPEMGATFRSVPVADSGDAGVLRLIFES
jgi:ABC-type proline/glycine betaine transport system permease subunit